MNKLDDFLKSKMSEAQVDTPSQWEALNEALPKSSKKGLVKWTLASLLFCGLVTVAVVVNQKQQTTKTYATDQVAQNQTPGNTVREIQEPSNPEVVSRETSPSTPGNGNHPVAGHSVTGNPQTPIYEKADPPKTDQLNIVPTEKGEENNTSPQVVNSENKEVEKTVKSAEQGDVVTASQPTRTAIKKKDPKEFHAGKLFIDATFSTILFSYRSFELSDGAAPYVNKQYDQLRQNSESSISSYGLSLGLEYKFAKSFSFQSGLSYNKIGFRSQYEFEVFDKPKTDANGRITGYDTINPFSTVFSDKTKIDVIRIPFGINYHIAINEKSLFHLYLGGAHDFIMSAKGTSLNPLTLEQESISKNDYVKTANEVCFDLGLKYAFAHSYGIGVDMYYNRWLTDIAKSKLENVTPFTGGINISLSRKIL